MLDLTLSLVESEIWMHRASSSVQEKLVLAILLAVFTVSPMHVNRGESSPMTPAQTAPELMPSLRCVCSPAGFKMPEAARTS